MEYIYIFFINIITRKNKKKDFIQRFEPLRFILNNLTIKPSVNLEILGNFNSEMDGWMYIGECHYDLNDNEMD